MARSSASSAAGRSTTQCRVISWICRQNYKKHDLAICKGHITTDSSYLDKLRDRRRFQSLKTRMEMYRLVSYHSTLVKGVSKYYIDLI